MSLNKKQCFFYKFIFLFVVSILLFSCASIQQPQGGPKDADAPKIVSETPKNYTLNFKSKKVILEFDEYFKLNNEYSEISISPNQENPPVYRIKQKRLEIELKDTLEKNTTYTINFGKAIGDVNENNLVKNYTYVFATGNEIDSLQISGKVLNSDDNKPMLDATVFIFPLERDTLFGKKKPSFFTTTDSSGNFQLRNLKEQEYTLYALKEEGGDKIYNSPKELIAFSSQHIILKKDTSGIVLNLFKEIPDTYKVIDKKIESDGKILIAYNRPIEKPSISFLSPNIKDPIINYSKNGDSTSIWVKDMEFDSLLVVTKNKDSILDTINIRRSKRDTYKRNILFTSNLSSGKIKPGNSLVLTFNLPLQNIDKSKILLLQDSLRLTNFQLENTDNTNRVFKISYPWKLKKLYSLTFAEDALTDIYGTKNKELKSTFELDEAENYGELNLVMTRADTAKNYIVQLVDEKNNVAKQSTLSFNSTLIYNLLNTGKYRIKVIEDLNKNGFFDTGNVKKQQQPEKSWFYEKEFIIRANWQQEEKIEIPKDF